MSCLICGDDKPLITLFNCHHQLCRQCFVKTVLNTQNYPVKCPLDCSNIIHTKDINKNLYDEELDTYFKNQRKQAVSTISTGLICSGVNCDFRGVINTSEGALYWLCPKCNIKNCYKCKKSHPGESCDLDRQLARNIQTALDKEHMMKCVTCGIFVYRATGCQFITCPDCKTELCWNHKTRFQKQGCNCGSHLRETPSTNLRETPSTNLRETPSTNLPEIPSTNSNGSWCIIS